MTSRVLLISLILVVSGFAQNGTGTTRTVMRSTYDRLLFSSPFSRVAVADENIVQITELSKRELLVLGVEIGRTSAIIWFDDGHTEQITISVERDLTVLRDALRDIDPSIELTTAPDRDAIVLRGEVSDISVLRAADAAARDYLAAGATSRGGSGTGQPLVQSTPEGVVDRTGETVRVDAPRRTAAALVNLIQVRSLPGRLDDRLREAVARMGTADVTVRRVQRGELPDDAEDVFVLEGEVDNQVQLTRILTVASRTVAGSGQAQDRIRVIADESGGLTNGNRNGGGQGQGGQGGNSGGGGGGFGGRGAGGQGGGANFNLTNNVRTNLGRAKVVELAGGRVLSFIDVRDIPQISVGIKLYEVNRTRLRNIGSDLGLLGSDFDQSSLNPATAGTTLQGGNAARVGGGGGSTDIQNALAFLGGGLTNQLQLVTGGFALDSVLSVLEANDIARQLSEPTLTVLSGEQAVFQVGGQIPVPQAFAPDAGQGLAQGVFSSVEFVSFGIQLGVRPLVNEKDEITLDLVPQVVNPDPTLTLLVGSTTGASVPTTAFETRSLRTTTRVIDGDALVLGGLVNRNRTRELAETPGLKDIPLLQWLFRDFSANDDEIELIVVVHPTIIRDPIPEAGVWEFPTTRELLDAGR